MEQSDAEVFYVPGSYLQTEMPEDKRILLRIRDEFVDIMCEVNPDYKPYVKYYNGKKVLYVNVLRAIYGFIESTLLWYNLYVKNLKHLMFIINKYGRFVANIMIYGNQCTIVWYVDDNKLLHVDRNTVTDILE